MLLCQGCRDLFIKCFPKTYTSRSRWPRGLKAYVCDRSIAGNAGSNFTEGMVFVPCVCCVGSGLCDEPITHSEESYPVCVCIIVCDLETSTMRRSRFYLGCCAIKIIWFLWNVYCLLTIYKGLYLPIIKPHSITPFIILFSSYFV